MAATDVTTKDYRWPKEYDIEGVLLESNLDRRESIRKNFQPRNLWWQNPERETGADLQNRSSSPLTNSVVLVSDQAMEEESLDAMRDHRVIAGNKLVGRVLGEESISAYPFAFPRAPVFSNQPVNVNPAPQSMDTQEEVIAHLRERGRAAVAEQIQEHLNELEQEADEKPVLLKSLKSLAGFILTHSQLKPALVSSTPDGLMGMTWCLPNQDNGDGYWGEGNCVVSLRFLPSRLIHYVALSAPKRQGEERITKRGDATTAYVLRSLGEFVPRITNG